MAIKKIFKAYIPSVNYVTQKGRTCVFVEGRFLTDNQDEITELNDVCERKSNPHIYIDPQEIEIDTTVQDRIRAASQRAVLEEMEKIAKEKGEGKGPEKSQAAQNASNVAGAGSSMSAATLLNVTNSAALSGLAKDSNGAGSNTAR